MIFVTVGTTKFSFDRLLKAVDKVMQNLKSKEKLVVQKGTSRYLFKYLNLKTFKEIPYNKMISYFKKARVIVTSGGPASTFQALKYGKNKPLVVPRSKKLGEHVDEHEIFFVHFLEERGDVEVAFPNDNLPEKLKGYLLSPSRSKKKEIIVASKNLIKKLIGYTES